ncbi:PucR family transcriptional regulator [Mycobacterium sp.]|uniref:PucR family transcriptional regulator n=1 Tax=Mycobacterium sp. TaxID=1785 RepID=UPI003C77857E
MTSRRRDSEVDPYVAMIAARLTQRVNEISAGMRKVIEEKITELAGDARTVELLAAGIEGNVETMLRALRDDLPVKQGTPPSAAIEYAKFLAQQGVPLNSLVRGYRLSQRRMTEEVFAELHEVAMEPAISVAVIETITTVLFEYVDWVTEQVVVAYEGEHERWLAYQNSIRAMKVRDMLSDNESEDVDAASTAIGYPLRWQHVALIVCYPDAERAGDGLGRLQQFTSQLAAAVGTDAGPLFVAADETSGWAWLPFHSAPGDIVAKVREFARLRAEGLGIAMGAAGSGVDGFRRSHRQAQRVRTAARARNQAPAVHAATDSGLLASAVLTTSVEELRAWVADVLGALASDTEHDAALRETLRVFLRARSGYHAAANDLNADINVVRHQVGHAVARRGRPIDDRVDVELALLVCQWYGAAVLRPK